MQVVIYESSVSDTSHRVWGMLQHTQNKLESNVPFPFHLNSGEGLASVQDERWVPVMPAESSPVPLFPKAHLEERFVFSSL